METKLSDLDQLKLPVGYDYVTKNRKICKKASGGLAVIYRKSLANYLKFHETESEFVIWIELSNRIFKIESNVLVGCIYIPPENSKYSSLEAFEEIENEMCNLTKNTENYVALVGDFNSKTGTLSDYIIPDETLLEMFDLDSDAAIVEFLYDFVKLKENDIPLQRVSKCTCRPNNYGHKLLELCKNNNLYIMNSRIGSDRNIGEKTCKDSSVVDYLILSSNMFPIITKFEIEEFLPLYSDCHCMLRFSLKTHDEKYASTSIQEENKQSFIKWKKEKKDEFINKIHDDLNGVIRNVNIKLDELSSNDNVTAAELNKIVSDIGENFKTAAAETFGKINKQKNSKKRENSKKWFNEKCELSRKKFHKARKRYSFIKNEENRQLMRAASKEHKITLNSAYRDYQEKTTRELRNLSKYDTKALWKILNSFNEQKRGDNDDISLQKLYDHFKNVNENCETNAEVDIVHDFSLDDISDEANMYLNGPVTETEIKKVVSKLKNGKAYGYDGNLNEYIKNTINDMMPVYVKLFNVILDTGIVPDSWDIGIMITIYKNKGSKTDPEMYRGITLNSCLSKTFSAVLDNRLNEYAEYINLISKVQAGFRKGHSTVDNIFVLYSLITIYFSRGKKYFVHLSILKVHSTQFGGQVCGKKC